MDLALHLKVERPFEAAMPAFAICRGKPPFRRARRQPGSIRGKWATLGGMEVHFTPEVQAKLDQLAAETGRARDEFVRDAMAGYFDELLRTRGMLDRRYDDIQSGKVQLMDGEEAFARLKEKTEAQRNRRA
jgi:hypothetical protein